MNKTDTKEAHENLSNKIKDLLRQGKITEQDATDLIEVSYNMAIAEVERYNFKTLESVKASLNKDFPLEKFALVKSYSEWKEKFKDIKLVITRN